MTPLWHILRALRLKHWTKNLLLFVPLVMAHRLDEIGLLLDLGLAFLSFGLIASAGYVVNDLLDLEADRAHPVRRHRPFAAGELGTAAGVGIVAGLIVAGLLVAFLWLPRTFTAMLVGYLLLTCSYSAYFKNKLLVDVIVLAGLYTYRIVAGGVAVDITVTTWLLAFSMFIFLSVAFAKRYSELRFLQAHDTKVTSGRAYLFEEMDLLLSLGPTMGCLSILVLALYISQSPEVGQLYASVPLLWFLCPVLLYWIMRLWFIARRGELPEDPVAFALTDRNSYIVGALAVALLFVASRWPVF
ncbi:MAG: UbiA family prenyltransferase [Planctomycetota bacterium]|jgi:4-hydroxybenzoate polyprenyltransferase